MAKYFESDQEVICLCCGGNKWEAVLTASDCLFLSCTVEGCENTLASVRQNRDSDNRCSLKVDRQATKWNRVTRAFDNLRATVMISS